MDSLNEARKGRSNEFPLLSIGSIGIDTTIILRPRNRARMAVEERPIHERKMVAELTDSPN